MLCKMEILWPIKAENILCLVPKISEHTQNWSVENPSQSRTLLLLRKEAGGNSSPPNPDGYGRGILAAKIKPTGFGRKLRLFSKIAIFTPKPYWCLRISTTSFWTRRMYEWRKMLLNVRAEKYLPACTAYFWSCNVWDRWTGIQRVPACCLPRRCMRSLGADSRYRHR